LAETQERRRSRCSLCRNLNRHQVVRNVLVVLFSYGHHLAAPIWRNSNLHTGKLRAIAITSAERSVQFPEVPTMEQAGVTGFKAGTWFGVLAPAGTPKPLIVQLSRAINAVLEEKGLRDTFAAQGAIVRGGTPAQFSSFFLSEYDKWGKIVKAALLCHCGLSRLHARNSRGT
jgi:hypothetical protein